MTNTGASATPKRHDLGRNRSAPAKPRRALPAPLAGHRRGRPHQPAFAVALGPFQPRRLHIRLHHRRPDRHPDRALEPPDEPPRGPPHLRRGRSAGGVIRLIEGPEPVRHRRRHRNDPFRLRADQGGRLRLVYSGPTTSLRSGCRSASCRSGRLSSIATALARRPAAWAWRRLRDADPRRRIKAHWPEGFPITTLTTLPARQRARRQRG